MCTGLSDRIRQVVACLCFIACAGPILIIVGGVALTARDNRQSEITSWTKVIAAFDATVLPTLRGTTAMLGNKSMSLSASTVVANSSQENVPNATSFPFTTISAPMSSWTFATTINGSASTASNVTLDGTNLTTTHKTIVSCTYNYCTSGCGGGKSSSYFCRNIKVTACSDGIYQGRASCFGSDGVCGTCLRTQYLTSVCAPMTLSSSNGVKTNASGVWQLAPVKRSCDYPFTQQQYGANYTSSIPVKLMSEQDPYITLSDITRGGNDFGMTAVSQRTGLAPLLIAGIAISVVVYGVIGVLIYRFCIRGSQPSYGKLVASKDACDMPQYTVRSAPYPAPVQQQMSYGAPPPQPMPHPQPRYPQPMHGYSV
jgi:hypothetical protein